jgi:glucosamine-6-phosphate deaminase
VLLLAFGANKARAIAQAVEGAVMAMNPASVLQLHPVVKVCLDKAAAARLKKTDYYCSVYANKPDWQRV